MLKALDTFHIDFLETPRFAPIGFANVSDFIKWADNAHRTVQPFSFPHLVEDSPLTVTFWCVCVCVEATHLSATETF